MAIIKRGKNTYLVRVYQGRHPITGKRLEINVTVHGTLEEAEKQEQLLKDKVAKEVPTLSARMTLRQLADLYLEETRYFRSESSQYLARELLDRYVLPYLGNREISKIRSSDIQQLFNFLLDPKKDSINDQKKRGR